MIEAKIVKVIKVGNSLAVVIPKEIASGLKIKRGDQVIFGVFNENEFCVRRITQKQLQDLKPNDISYE